ncbi:MAG: PEGA domain-containing protein [Deltaproteobacteria bacterium]|nr:PEGA domain-containing protein [Deltaproteobacteria bacterium]MDQ3299859.1 PEGA domain-containing protein [Myxococcota bacterium]
MKIDSAPQGAQVYIGDKSCGPVGNTPWTGTLNAATVTVIVEAAGYEPAIKSFKVGRVRKVQELFVPLTRQPQLEIRADADPSLVGATVSVDGVAQGTIQGPMVIKTTAGRHLIEIKKEGFETLTQWVDLSTTPALTLTPTLKAVAKAKYGTIVVEADVQDAEVYVDGNKHPDNTPSVISNVIEGVHVIEVKKAPGPPWRQTVTVVANQQTKVRAELAPLLHGGVGVIRVLSDAPGARANIDGIDMGPVPVDIKDVKAGEHIVQVKASGFKTGEKKVTVTAGGSQVVKFDLNPEVAADQGTIKVLSAVPEAEVIIDGAVVGKAPQEKKVSAGEHSVMVRLAGYKPFEQKVRVETGKVLSIMADLKGVGRLRILSNPAGASVLINGLPAKDKDGRDKTPMDVEVETGKTIVRLEMPGFVASEETINIQGGQTETLSRELSIAGKSESELKNEQKGLSSWGARALPRGRSTVDFDAGYPYFGGLRITVGAGRISQQWGFDASIGVRTMFARTELGFGGRMMVANQEPFSAALFSNLWYGTKLFDNKSERNGATFDAGILASLTALSNVTITGRAYLEFWSDRHCPEINGSGASASFKSDAKPTKACDGYLKTAVRGETVDGFTPMERARMEELTGESGGDMFGRDYGVRFMLSLIAEIAVRQRWNLFGIIEGAPFQDERALFTDQFSGPMAEEDLVLYGRVGLSYKF